MLKLLRLKPGVNRENTRYTNENGWYESDKVRFRQGTPEKIGGWQRISANTFVGICRSLWNWVTLAGQNLMGVGTNLKFYIENGGAYYDITPVAHSSSILSARVVTTSGSSIVSIIDEFYLASVGQYVTLVSAGTIGGITFSGSYEIISVTRLGPPGVPPGLSFIDTGVVATSTAVNATGCYAVYQSVPGPAIQGVYTGWGANTWGSGSWGFTSLPTNVPVLNIWNQGNFGQDLIFGQRGYPLYYWNATIGYSNTEVTITIATPCEVTCSLNLADLTAISFNTTDVLPTGILPGVVYYVKYLTSTTFNIATSPTASATLTGVSIINAIGTFICTTSSIALAVGQSLTISGTYGGTGSITGYANPTKYYIIAIDGDTSFTLSTSAGGPNITTTVGTPTGLTYTVSTIVNTSGTQSGIQSIVPNGIALSALSGANAVPLSQNYFLVSDASRFVICFGTNDYLSTVFNPMLIRWSDQENAVEWAPAATNQAGSVLLSHGSKIVTALQSRQEILVWTDSTLYSLQYLGAPIVWGTQLQGDNISIAGPNAAALASGVVYWMGVDKFYKYDGRVSTLRCDLRQYIYNNINLGQNEQIFASTNEGFNEVWFFYCSANSTAVDSYVVYNYAEDNGNGVWYYGSMARTAWIDTGLRNYPIAATYANNLVNHESGVDDGTLADPVGISAFITSAQFDLDDGNNMAFSWRMLPDLTFRGSTDGTTPSLTMQLLPLKNSGSGYNDPKSVGGVSTDAQATVTATQTYPIDLDTYNGQVNIRIRARQMAMKIASTQLGTQWQLGSPRIDLRTDGRR
jgi:hypothetical protein